MKHLNEVYEGEPFNFQMVYNGKSNASVLHKNKLLASPQVTFPASHLCRISEVHTKEGTLHVQLRKARRYEGKPETYLFLKYLDVFFAGARVGRAVTHRAETELEAVPAEPCWGQPQPCLVLPVLHCPLLVSARSFPAGAQV